ncbi:extracellular solute-binding protein [Patescibacteria group bacterium]|nr:extracellular solute-binding protein [Patescibacteria group bacterium]
MISKTKLTILTLILISMPLMGFGCKFSQSSEVEQLYKPIELNWWGVWEETADVATLINAYQTIHPNIKVKYRKFRFEEYEAELTKAWLEQRGPEIFSIPSTLLRQYENLIKPMPSSMRIPFLEIKKGLKEEQIITVKTISGLTPKKVQELFAPVVHEQVIINDEVYGLPLSVDTLALYYNRDLLNSAKIPLPATTWAELVEHVKDLTTYDNDGNILQSGIALGSANNIPRANDILSLLMMQNGAQMTGDNNYATFNQAPPDQGRFYPGKDALEFYVDFIDPTKEVYSWTEDKPDALEMFTSGKLAYFIGYAYQAPIIKAQSPKLNFNISPMLQTVPDVQEVNFADFWALTTYFGAAEEKLSPAWDFIRYITTTPELTKKYLEESKQPTALLSLINDQIQTESMGIFADQVLNARAWYRGYDAAEADNAMSDLIYQAYHNVSSELATIDILDLTVRRINQTIRKPE